MEGVNPKKEKEDGTAKNTIVSPDFLLWKFCGKAQFPGDSPKTMRKLCLSA